MLFEHEDDQAAGLRRLLLSDPARVVMVASAQAGLGATSVVVNLAAMLAQTGRNVLVLDENLSHANASSMLGLKPRHDLLDAVRGGKTWREIALPALPKVRVLPVARAVRSLPRLPATERAELLACLAGASCGADIVLVDTAPCPGVSPVSAALAPDQPLLLVLNATAAAITESYAMIKRLAMNGGRQDFLVAVNRARGGAEALKVFGNLEQVARQHLRVRVEYLGFIPVDEKLGRATQLRRPVVDAFPSAPAASAFAEIGRNLMLLPGAGNQEAASLPDLVQRLMGRSRSTNTALAAY